MIFVLGNVFKSEEKDEYILNCRINEELEHQKYRNKPCGIYYIDNKKATEMLNGKGFQLPRAFNLNGLVNNIQGESLIVKKYEDIKKEGKVAIQTVIAQYGFTQDFSEIRNQVVALITSVNTIRQSHPMVNDIYEQKSKKVIFVLWNVFKSEEKAEYILNCRINEELEHQKYVNKPCGIYYIDNKKATEMLNSKGFELPRGFNLNGLVNNIQGELLIVKQEDTQNHKTTNFEVSGNTETTTPAETSTPSLLTLTNDEIHTLEHFIQRRYESDKKNANLRNLQLVITDVDKKGNKLDRYNFTTCFSDGNVPNTIKKRG